MVGPPRSQWAALYANGLTLIQIAVHAGVCQQSVAKHLRAAGVELRRRGPRNGERGPHVVKRQRASLAQRKPAAAPPAPIDPVLTYPVGDERGYIDTVGY